MSDLVDTTDFIPSMFEAANIELPKDEIFDGHSFVPQIRGEKGAPETGYSSITTPCQAITKRVAVFLAGYRTSDFNYSTKQATTISTTSLPTPSFCVL